MKNKKYTTRRSLEGSGEKSASAPAFNKFQAFLRGSCGLTLITCCLLSGCATVHEAARGFAGVSTRILEDKRKEALRESYPMDYDTCYARVKAILGEKVMMKQGEEEIESRSYIYAEDPQQKMIAIYLSETDTTPVGIFFVEDGRGRTMIEVSSPSTYAKENIAGRISSGIREQLKQDRQEKKTDAKE
ncbi:MAG: hypothetical protein PHW98_05555 [Candidatus Omnitrophica bacterium]|nr:hypothetical protein [Candidatus Omnitrophota bacterium]